MNHLGALIACLLTQTSTGAVCTEPPGRCWIDSVDEESGYYVMGCQYGGQTVCSPPLPQLLYVPLVYPRPKGSEFREGCDGQ